MHKFNIFRNKKYTVINLAGLKVSVAHGTGIAMTRRQKRL